MTTPETLLYAGYGANRDPKMIEAITGHAPKAIGVVAIQDVELCVQRLDQAPDTVFEGSPEPISVRQILNGSWGEESDFETYTIRPKKGGMVDAMLFELSQEERDLIAEWEMIEFGWYKRMQVQARLGDGTLVTAETEGLRDGQEVDRTIDTMGYPTYLNDPADMFRIAEKARREYYDRQQQK